MIRLFLTKLFADRAVWALPVAGFGLTSGIGLMVFGGSMYFYTLDDPWLRDVYAIYATAALILLLIPMLALMSSAAKLLARRRDERLAGLRLLGASSVQLVGPWLLKVITTVVVSASIVAFPIVGWAILSAPATVAVVAAVLAAGVLLIRCGLLATRPTLQRVIAAG